MNQQNESPCGIPGHVRQDRRRTDDRRLNVSDRRNYYPNRRIIGTDRRVTDLGWCAWCELKLHQDAMKALHAQYVDAAADKLRLEAENQRLQQQLSDLRQATAPVYPKDGDPQYWVMVAKRRREREATIRPADATAWQHVVGLEQENQRLREALEGLSQAAHPFANSGYDPDLITMRTAIQGQNLRRALEQAKAALDQWEKTS